MKWFRLYHEFVDDPKIAMMSDSDQLLWVKALCLASDSSVRGMILLSDEEICWKLRCTVETWKHAIDKFRAKGMIEHNTDGPGYTVVNWDKRQFESDSSAERVRKHRAAKTGKPDPKPDASAPAVTETNESEPCNVTVTPSEQSITKQSIPIPDQSGPRAQLAGMNRPVPVDRLAAQFMRHPWRGSDGKVLPEYLDHVASQMKKDGNMHPKVMASRHIDKLEKAQDYDTLNLYLEQCQDQPERKSTTPAQVAADIAELAKQAIAQERAS